MQINRVLLISAMLIDAAPALQPNPAMLRAIFEDALTRQREQYGVFDTHTAQAARDLGLFLARQGQTAEAHNVLEQVARIDEQVFGPENSQTLADVAALAALSKPAQAEPLWRRASASTDSSTAARAFAELGKLHVASGDTSGAIDFYRRAVAKEESAGGKSSPTAAMYLNSLAKLLSPSDAIPLLERALNIDRQQLGSRHAETATTEANLAGLLADSPRNEEAIRLATEAFQTFRQVLGPDHPRTALSASILGYCYEIKGDRRGAEEMYRLALSIDQRAFGRDAPESLNDAKVLNEFLKSISRAPR
jgi:tetratricopeptide (TPR) repeat protein